MASPSTGSPHTPNPMNSSTTPMDGSPINKIKRTNKACLNCRKRKSRCHLETKDNVIQLPCARCKEANLECILGSSNRGGRRIRKPKPTLDQSVTRPEGTAIGGPLPSPPRHPSILYEAEEPNIGFHGLGNVGTNIDPPHPHPQPSPYAEASGNSGHLKSRLSGSVRDTRSPTSSSSAAEETIPFATLQNPSDALEILAQVAETSTGEEDPRRSNHLRHMARESYRMPPPPLPMQPTSTSDARRFGYRLLDDGHLTVSKMSELLRRYEQLYHPYFPLAPRKTFDPARLNDLMRNEPHLLTAILVISSKDLLDEGHIYEACAAQMKCMVSDLAAGGPGDVEAVEALLVLAEWTPYTQRSLSGTVGRGEEDREAWMHVGMALRIGYFLGVDRTSFRLTKDEGKDPEFSRRRLAWTACYISDRQISIRIGRAFWSRGPGPLTTLRREDYPSLQPQSPNDEDYASIFQAHLELTMLFSNVHDVLYANPGSSFRSHLSGGYIKYIDDFRSAIYGWKSIWGTLTCSPYLKAMLLLSYDYLRLYTNAFAFQATIRRALPATEEKEPNNRQSPSRVFLNNVAAVGDARFIYEGLDAAKAVLTTINNFVDPERSLRYMPLRFYLYAIYSGVFLYRARCVGVMSPEEERAIRAMIKETVSRLQRSSVGTQHLGSRYSELLKLLWDKVEHKHKGKTPNSNGVQPARHPSIAALTNPTVNGFGSSDGNGSTHLGSAGAAPSLGTGDTSMTDYPEHMGDFSWTDLDAVGNFAMNVSSGSGVLPGDSDGLWTGFLPLEVNGGWDGGLWDAGNGTGQAGFTPMMI